MKMPLTPTPLVKPSEEPMYSPEYYDAEYYGKGGRGGFKSYDYQSAEQKSQLEIKRSVTDQVPHDSTLFIGCALGFEVAHEYANGKRAIGLDVSTYAIAHQIPEANGMCFIYDGWEIPAAGNDTMDLVASFDVLSHLPDLMLESLAAEMVRVAKNGIVFRVVVKNWRNRDTILDAQDGAWVRYRPWEKWDELFSRSGKFKLDWLKMHGQYEVTALYRRDL